ncbi:MAG: response regulator [Victivallales bacterium]|nr:response regulator [Victivallales bacterium]
MQNKPLLDGRCLMVGMSILMAQGCQRVKNFHNLLEDEWAGRESALDFLHQGTTILGQLLEWNSGITQVLLDEAATDSLREVIGTAPLLAGVARNLPNAQMHDRQSTIVAGNTYQLQALLLDMGLAVSANSTLPLLMACFQADFSEAMLSSVRSSLSPDKYAIIGMTAQENAEINLDTYVTLPAYLNSLKEGGEPLRLIAWLGATALHKGEVLVHQSGPLHGVLLLLPTATAHSDESLRAHQRKDSRPETILLVDDEDMIWDVVFDMLTDLGYTVVMAGNGREAVEIFQANPSEFDLVLLDMLMPEMNGSEAFYELKKSAPDIRVLLASGYVNEEDVQDVLTAGANGFLRKPYRLRDLARKIRDILDK